MAAIAGSRGKCHFGAQTRRRTAMQAENDTQAVRRVLARAGITAAALTLSLGAAAPAALACHGGGGHGDSGGFPAARPDRDGATQDKRQDKSSSGETSHHRRPREEPPGGGSP